MKKTGVKIPVYGARALRDVYAKCHVSRLVKNYQPKSFKSSITWFEKSPIRFTFFKCKLRLAFFFVGLNNMSIINTQTYQARQNP